MSTDKISNEEQGNLHKPIVSSRFVLLKGVAGNVFWTTDDGSDHDGYTVLHRGTESDEMVSKWEDYYRGRL